jgi:alpha-D-glucose phosphate-specific phosphoglucomutase
MATIKFGTDGWRGVIAQDFTFENVRIVAHAIARYVARAEKPGAGFVVGFDSRYGSDRFARAAAEAVAATGIEVALADHFGPTPAVSLLVKMRGASGGIQISASHNPYQWNGIKYKASYGSSAGPAIVAEIEKELAAVLRDGVPSLPARLELIKLLDIRKPYLEKLDTLVDWEKLRAANFRFIVDPMHGAGSGLLSKLFENHGIECKEIRKTHDVLFGGAHPEPIEPHVEPARRAVLEGKYDAAFVLDGDADRIGAIDRDGAFVNPHRIFSILLWHLAGTRNLSGDVVKTFSTTKLIDKIAAKYERKLWETPIGFKYVCDRMLESDVLLGGEESGGIGTKLYLPERDATVSALLLAEVMAWHRKSLGELVAMLHKEFGEHHYGRIDLMVKEAQKKKAIDYFSDPALKQFGPWPVTRREAMDGVKIYVGDAGWGMVRTSGTEPMLRLYSETNNPETTKRVLAEISKTVQSL